MGKIILSCGCEYTEDMGSIESLSFEFEDFDCDPIEGFYPVIVSGVYCKKCQERFNEQLQQEEVR